MKNYHSIPEKMQKYSELINNTINDSEIVNEVANFGYTAEKLGVGKTLLEETISLITKHGDEDIEKMHASNEFNVQRTKVSELYMTDRKIARVALRNHPELLQVNLGVKGIPSDVYSKWVIEVEQFYGNIIKSETILEAFALLGRNKEYFEQQLSEIETLKTLKLNQKKEMGDAQIATQERDEKIIELDTWANDYKVVARIVFEDRPQTLEKLGILVRA